MKDNQTPGRRISSKLTRRFHIPLVAGYIAAANADRLSRRHDFIKGPGLKNHFLKCLAPAWRGLHRGAAAWVAAAGLTLAVQPVQAAPTLIGDTLSFMRAYPDKTTSYGSAIPDTTVVAGTSDTVFWGASGNVFTGIDPEANSIAFNLYANTSYLGTATIFDGYVVSGIDFDIASVSLLSNTSSLVVQDLTFDAHGFSFSLSGVTRAGDLIFSIVAADVAASVPEPTSLLLAYAGLFGVLATRRVHPRRVP